MSDKFLEVSPQHLHSFLNRQENLGGGEPCQHAGLSPPLLDEVSLRLHQLLLWIV